MTESGQLPSNIFIGAQSLKQLALFLERSFSATFVLVDENTLQHCYPFITGILPVHTLIQIPAGEEQKNIDTCGLIWRKLTEENADRSTLLINFGGGVISDIGGFAAGCYKRGIKFTNLPTSLLAMVDASVGAKTGIDFMGYKNQVGLFNEPEAVFIHPQFLNTLPQKELTSGFAEVLKHYLISDAGAFGQISRNLPDLREMNWEGIINRNVQIKSAIVTSDPQEKGIRKALNFGHTFGHAIESYGLNKPAKKLLHGEAVAIGMVVEGCISMKKGMLTGEELDLIAAVILHYFDLPYIPISCLPDLLGLIRQDKKNLKQQTQFTLLKGIGNYSINNSVEEEQILESLNYYNSLLE